MKFNHFWTCTYVSSSFSQARWQRHHFQLFSTVAPIVEVQLALTCVKYAFAKTHTKKEKDIKLLKSGQSASYSSPGDFHGYVLFHYYAVLSHILPILNNCSFLQFGHFMNRIADSNHFAISYRAVYKQHVSRATIASKTTCVLFTSGCHPDPPREVVNQMHRALLPCFGAEDPGLRQQIATPARTGDAFSGRKFLPRFGVVFSFHVRHTHTHTRAGSSSVFKQHLDSSVIYQKWLSRGDSLCYTHSLSLSLSLSVTHILHTHRYLHLTHTHPLCYISNDLMGSQEKDF